MRGLSASRSIALVVVAATIGCFAAALALGGGDQLPIGGPFALAFSVVGLLIAWHLPRNVLGWLLLAIPGFVSVFVLGGSVAMAASRHHPYLALAAFGLTQFFYYLFLFAAPLTLLFFPDGRLPSSRWRPVLVCYALLTTGVQAVTIAGDVALATRAHLAWTAAGNPRTGPPSWLPLLTLVFLLPSLVLVLAWVVGRVIGFRRSTGVLRQQYKWLAVGALGLLIALEASFITPGGSSTTAHVLSAVTAAAALPFPVTIGVAVLRWHLYDIDRVISRTLSWAAVTAVIAAVYVGTVALATKILPFSSPVAVAASTLVAVALFNPLRRRLQHLVDRRFNRVRYDAETTVEAFVARLRDVVGLEAVKKDYVETVARAVEPSTVVVWMAAPPKGAASP